MVQKSYRTIVIHAETYDELKRLGTVTESFNDVIWKLIASGAGSSQGSTGQNARKGTVLTKEAKTAS
jgi:hypothetical protein